MTTSTSQIAIWIFIKLASDSNSFRNNTILLHTQVSHKCNMYHTDSCVMTSFFYHLPTHIADITTVLLHMKSKASVLSSKIMQYI